MRPPTALVLAALVASAAIGASVALGATGGVSADPGVTSTSIVLGGTAPLSGPTAGSAAIARGADAYLRYVNARGGVHGRKIEYTYLDDADSPAQAVQATRQLVEKDRVFAIFNAVGTGQNEAIREYLNTQGVPQLFAASGATALGADAERYPYTIGLQPSYQAEGWVYGKYLARTRPGARVAVLFQDDAYGRELLAGLRRGLQRSTVKVVAAEPYAAGASEVGSRVTRLRSSGANVLALFAAPRFAVQAYGAAGKLGWRPKLTIASAAATAGKVMSAASLGGGAKVVPGAVSIAFLKDPSDPQWAKDRGVSLYRQVLRQHAPGADPDDVGHVYGMAAAWTLVEVLKRAGKDLTRAGIVSAVSSMSLTGNPFLLPGIALRTGVDDHFPIEQMLLQRWQKGAWRSFGGLWSHRAP